LPNLIKIVSKLWLLKRQGGNKLSLKASPEHAGLLQSFDCEQDNSV